MDDGRREGMDKSKHITLLIAHTNTRTRFYFSPSLFFSLFRAHNPRPDDDGDDTQAGKRMDGGLAAADNAAPPLTRPRHRLFSPSLSHVRSKTQTLPKRKEKKNSENRRKKEILETKNSHDSLTVQRAQAATADYPSRPLLRPIISPSSPCTRERGNVGMGNGERDALFRNTLFPHQSMKNPPFGNCPGANANATRKAASVSGRTAGRSRIERLTCSVKKITINDTTVPAKSKNKNTAHQRQRRAPTPPAHAPPREREREKKEPLHAPPSSAALVI